MMFKRGPESKLKKKKFEAPHTYVIIFAVVIFCWLLTFMVPVGKYDMQTVEYQAADGTTATREVVVEGSFRYKHPYIPEKLESALTELAADTETLKELVLLCKQAAKNFHTICKKETALKRVLSNLLSAVSLLRFKAVFSCGFRVPPGSGLYQSCAAGSVCIPAGQKYCSPRPRKSCPADRKTPGLPSRCIGHRW